MITHLFNSSIVSGPEMLVIPALKKLGEPVSVIFLTETRLARESEKPLQYARDHGLDVYSVPVRGRWDRQAFLELRKVIDQINPRIIHAHDVKASLYLHQAKRVRSPFAASLVSTHHGASYRKGKIRLYEELYVRFVLPHFDKVLCVCEIDQSSVIRRGVAPEKVSIHLNGTDRKRVSFEERESKQRQIRAKWKVEMPTLPEPDSATFIGMVARLSSEKRHDRMLRILSEFKKFEQRDGAANTVLLCFGVGREEATLRKLAQKLKIEDRVFFMGYSNTISEEMAGFDALICVSDGEGIPINLLEAGWAATPVISTRVGGIPDLIATPEHGYLVDQHNTIPVLAEQMWDALQNKEKLQAVGRAYQERITAHFTHDAWLSHLKAIYSEMKESVHHA